MAFGAEPRPRHFQHVFGIAAVGVVTAQAIFPHRSMFEKERSSLFGMALVASVVDRVFLQHRLGRAAVRIVAILQVILPSRSGMCDERNICARRSLWHWKQVSISTTVLRAALRETCRITV